MARVTIGWRLPRLGGHKLLHGLCEVIIELFRINSNGDDPRSKLIDAGRCQSISPLLPQREKNRLQAFLAGCLVRRPLRSHRNPEAQGYLYVEFGVEESSSKMTGPATSDDSEVPRDNRQWSLAGEVWRLPQHGRASRPFQSVPEIFWSVKSTRQCPRGLSEHPFGSSTTGTQF
ncbi:hypothetical protein L207DRAFT_525723 [Hyaloscypha variabilis F]|uniref:Uncharacterized protein n=1 Tax=Hyaloscypha variabilis (strain UAMH 11265 / GT02V1 / F) TaxID=1149755 RepID=A0A2J6S0T8_HYAVF|nr:hypothetical protein L207DRAFT_525723 [Hyaloscypha variabilis F]